MAKASLIGLITQGPELQHSTKGEPYVRFSVLCALRPQGNRL